MGVGGGGDKNEESNCELKTNPLQTPERAGHRTSQALWIPGRAYGKRLTQEKGLCPTHNQTD